MTWNLQAKAGESIAVTFRVKIKDDANDKEITNQALVRIGDNEFTTNEVINPTPGDVPSEPTGEGNLVVKKTLEGRKLKAGEFSFKLTPENGAPGEDQTAVNDADGNVKFSAIIFRKVGDYEYKISEVPGKLGGVTYSKAEYTAIAEVRQDKKDKTKLVVTWKIDGREDKTAEFVNKYETKPVSVNPPVQKVITGNDDLYNKGDFTFTIENTSKPEGVDAAPMPAKTSITNSADNEAEGREAFYEFGAIEFTAPGTYVYTVKESGTVDGVTNDPAASEGKTLTFEVTDNGEGQLVVSPTTDQIQIAFTNVYNADGEATIVAAKALKDGTWPADKKLTLTLTAEEGTPMPETTSADLDAAGSVTFGPIKYSLKDKGKSYVYTISEGNGFGGTWTGSGDITATVKVEDNGDGTLAANVTYDPENATITNSYKAEGSVQLEAAKALEGVDWPEGKELKLTLTGEG